MRAKYEFEAQIRTAKESARKSRQSLKDATKTKEQIEQEAIPKIKNDEDFIFKTNQINPIIELKNGLLKDANQLLLASSSNWLDRNAALTIIDFCTDIDKINQSYLDKRLDFDNYQTEMAIEIHKTSAALQNNGKFVIALANLLSCVLTLGGAAIYRAVTGSWFFKNTASPSVVNLQNKVVEIEPAVDGLKI